MFLTRTSRISPHDQSNIAKRTINPETINVGYLGTNPVCKYSTNTGINRPNAMSNKIVAIMEKKIMACNP